MPRLFTPGGPPIRLDGNGRSTETGVGTRRVLDALAAKPGTGRSHWLADSRPPLGPRGASGRDQRGLCRRWLAPDRGDDSTRRVRRRRVHTWLPIEPVSRSVAGFERDLTTIAYSQGAGRPGRRPTSVPRSDILPTALELLPHDTAGRHSKGRRRHEGRAFSRNSDAGNIRSSAGDGRTMVADAVGVTRPPCGS